MATTVGSHSVAAFTSPNNGDALDANVVKSNDNTLRVSYVDHDADPGIHLQSSTLAARPAAGTVGRKWLTTDSGSVKLWYDDGANWQEINYIQNSGTATVTGDLVVQGNTTIGNATSDTLTVTARVVSDVVPSTTNSRDLGTTTLRWKDLYLAGNANVTGTLTVSGSTLLGAATVSSLNSVGTVTAATFSGSGASLTNVPAASVNAGTFGSGNFTFQGFVRAGRQTSTGVTGSVSVNVANFNHTRITLGGNVTISFTGGVTGGVYTLEVLQDGAGGRSTAWGAGVVWSNGAAPTGTTTANRKDVYSFFYDGSNYIGTLFATNVTSTG
jgi:hypothetical protein